MKTYKEVTTYLDSFINYEKKPFFPYHKSLKLERVRSLFNALDIAYGKLKVIHIAGTKGKGSAATFCAYMLAASGIKVGLFTSPHLFDFRERIVVFKKRREQVLHFKISKKDVAKILRKLKPAIDKFKKTIKFEEPTFFEVFTAIALEYFLEKKVDVVVLETGLGGRLDATNVVNPLISIITHIDYDHTDKLGKRLSQIAYEKAGIIKKGIPVISDSQRKAALGVLREQCNKMEAPLFIYGKDFSAKHIRLKNNYTAFDFQFSIQKVRNAKVYLKGKYQVQNAALAVAAISFIKENSAIRDGLAQTHLEGRFEIAKRNPLIILDIAHNPVAFSVLKDNLKTYFPSKKVILIFAASKDKDIEGMLKNLPFSHLILTRFNNPRSMEPFQIQRQTKIRDAFIAPDIKGALAIAESLYNKDSLILVSGSLYLVAEAKKLLQARGI
ncbi:MAG: bifunctional folylpolyglutamate synthase/dihydrofolate synthase [Candidatus Omnitrophota bacterium]|nr:MAG: bifunctional folylpolyglutamate synthase/dihydrofolate synthase [Candidatus Omnitrophota bacterium]